MFHIDILIVTDINECTTDTHGCNNGATCLNTDGSYTCTCAMGWTGDMCAIGECFLSLYDLFKSISWYGMIGLFFLPV